MASPENDHPSPPFHVVAMPYPGRGHINPMLNLCKAVAKRGSRNNIHITVVVTEEWLGFLGGVSADKPLDNFRFTSIPNVVPSEKDRGDDMLAFLNAVLTKMEEPFERLLEEGRVPPPDFIIADAFLPWAGGVAGRRNIPVAHLWTMSASVYTVFYHFDLLVENGHFPVDLSVNGDAIVDYIPGLSPTQAVDLPSILRDQQMTTMFLKVILNKSKSKHLIFDSIYELESQVFESLKQKSAFSIHNIGPASSYSKLTDTTTTASDHSNWLDRQPPSSVLYVSLGSYLYISSTQMDEIAFGLKKSRIRFLWVARRDATRLQEICGENGMVVEWCDQLKVLNHPSVGGFWSHCGWNSTKEAVMTGVPVIASPIMMDQLPNAKAIVEDWGMGWRILHREFGEGNLARGDEIAEMVGRFMDLESKERKELMRNAREMKKVCEREFASGGSFEMNVDGFIESIMGCK